MEQKEKKQRLQKLFLRSAERAIDGKKPHNAACKSLYDNLRRQGKSHDEAIKQVMYLLTKQIMKVVEENKSNLI